MKKEILEIAPKYIVDNTGKKTAVILEIATFEDMLERLEDMYFGLKAEQALQEDEFLDFNELNKKN